MRVSSRWVLCVAGQGVLLLQASVLLLLQASVLLLLQASVLLLLQAKDQKDSRRIDTWQRKCAKLTESLQHWRTKISNNMKEAVSREQHCVVVVDFCNRAQSASHCLFQSVLSTSHRLSLPASTACLNLPVSVCLSLPASDCLPLTASHCLSLPLTACLSLPLTACL